MVLYVCQNTAFEVVGHMARRGNNVPLLSGIPKKPQLALNNFYLHEIDGFSNLSGFASELTGYAVGARTTDTATFALVANTIGNFRSKIGVRGSLPRVIPSVFVAHTGLITATRPQCDCGPNLLHDKGLCPRFLV